MDSAKSSEREKFIQQLITPLSNDLLSGSAEIALQAITIFHSIISSADTTKVDPAQKRYCIRIPKPD